MKRKYIEDAPSENHQSLESAIFQDNIDIGEEIVVDDSKSGNVTCDEKEKNIESNDEPCTPLLLPTSVPNFERETFTGQIDFDSKVTKNVMADEKEQKICFDVATQTPPLPIMSIDNFENDDAGVNFYTGLETFSQFFLVLQTLGPAAYCLNYVYDDVTDIGVPDQLFLVLMKLRRHTINFELSLFFKISEKTVENVFHTWILFMSYQWREIDIWPSKDIVKCFSPSDFKLKFPNTRVIVDIVECPIRKPKLKESQKATYSASENKYTVKTLVGITPSGIVSYVSQAYNGSTSDSEIVEESTDSLLNLCDPGDSIMIVAGKGSDGQDVFVHKNIKVDQPDPINISSCLGKRNEMSCAAVGRHKKVSSGRVHIEPIIRQAKTFRILTERMNSSETKLASHITFVCFMLCNFKTSVLPYRA